MDRQPAHDRMRSQIEDRLYALAERIEYAERMASITSYITNLAIEHLEKPGSDKRLSPDEGDEISFAVVDVHLRIKAIGEELRKIITDA